MPRAALTLAVCLTLATSARAAEQAARPQVELELGVARFNRDLSSLLSLGPAWGVRARVPLRETLSLVIGYQGAATRVDTPEVEGSPLLLSNAGYAAVELGVAGSWAVRPYLFVGAGLVRSTPPESARAVLAADTAGVIPVGLGLEGSLSEHLVLGGRFTYDLLFDNELRPGAGSLAADLWFASLSLAYRF